MLTALWYTLLFMLQVAQMDGSTDYSRLDMDVFVDSAPVWTVTVKGNAREGQLWAGKTLLGEYDASSRLSQAYLIRPEADLPEGVGDKKDAGSKDAKSAAKTPAPSPASPSASGEPEEKPLPPVIAMDFTGIIKQLKSHPDKGIQVIVPDLVLESKEGQKGGAAKVSPTPAPTPKAAAKASPASGTPASPAATGIAASPEPSKAPEDAMELRRHANRIILAWPSQGIVVVMTRR